MDTKGLFEINSRKLRKSGVKGLGKVKMFGNRKSAKRRRGLKHHKVHGLLG